jgi:hypothetical protein
MTAGDGELLQQWRKEWDDRIRNAPSYAAALKLYRQFSGLDRAGELSVSQTRFKTVEFLQLYTAAGVKRTYEPGEQAVLAEFMADSLIERGIAKLVR